MREARQKATLHCPSAALPLQLPQVFFSHYDVTRSEPADWPVPLTPRLQNAGLMTATVDDQRLLFVVDLLELLDPLPVPSEGL